LYAVAGSSDDRALGFLKRLDKSAFWGTRRVFKLDRALDDPERIAASQSLIEQEAERRKTKR